MELSYWWEHGNVKNAGTSYLNEKHQLILCRIRVRDFKDKFSNHGTRFNQNWPLALFNMQSSLLVFTRRSQYSQILTCSQKFLTKGTVWEINWAVQNDHHLYRMFKELPSVLDRWPERSWLECVQWSCTGQCSKNILTHSDRFHITRKWFFTKVVKTNMHDHH